MGDWRVGWGVTKELITNAERVTKELITNAEGVTKELITNAKRCDVFC